MHHRPRVCYISTHLLFPGIVVLAALLAPKFCLDVFSLTHILGLVRTKLPITAVKQLALGDVHVQFPHGVWCRACAFIQLVWHHWVPSEEWLDMSWLFCSDKKHTWFLSLRFTVLDYQPWAEVSISAAKKRCVPKPFGRTSQRFVFQLLPKLATVFKEKKHKPDKSMEKEPALILHFLPRKVAEFMIMTKRSGQVDKKILGKTVCTAQDQVVLYSKSNMWYIFKILLKSLVS